ncbi:MAG: chemotaxis response regulator protein-glutamate methylesterase [Bacilli bacterium]|nr:chemotaxis response regulator protein-glutamate methylesterase [Bacilli bacterium]
MEKIRVLVVDDSALMRLLIRDILQRDAAIQVVGIAKNGAEALEVIPHLHPDVVTLDIEMPVSNGLQTLPLILEQYGLPVIMLSSLTSAGARETITALELGAFDFVAKPSGHISLDVDQVAEDLTAKVKAAAAHKQKSPYAASPLQRIPRKTNDYAWKDHTHNDDVRTSSSMLSPLASPGHVRTLIAIGASTGGPRALQHLLQHLPGNLPAAIVIVQHMPPGFTRSLAERLNHLCALNVVEAVDGQQIREGHVYIAPGNFHMEVKESESHYRIHLHQAAAVNGHRPAVDVLFQSVAAAVDLPLLAVILTGMGRDGTEGMELIKQRGGRTIAEAEESCIVYGMPRAAIEKGCVDEVRPLALIADALVSHLL